MPRSADRWSSHFRSQRDYRQRTARKATKTMRVGWLRRSCCVLVMDRLLDQMTPSEIHIVPTRLRHTELAYVWTGGCGGAAGS